MFKFDRTIFNKKKQLSPEEASKTLNRQAEKLTLLSDELKNIKLNTSEESISEVIGNFVQGSIKAAKYTYGATKKIISVTDKFINKVKDFITDKIVDEKYIVEQFNELKKKTEALKTDTSRTQYVYEVPTYQTVLKRLNSIIKVMNYLNGQVDNNEPIDIGMLTDNIARESNNIVEKIVDKKDEYKISFKWKEPVLEDHYNFSESQWANDSNRMKIKNLIYVIKFDCTDKLNTVVNKLQEKCEQQAAEDEDASTIFGNIYILGSVIKEFYAEAVLKEVNTFMMTYMKRLNK